LTLLESKTQAWNQNNAGEKQNKSILFSGIIIFLLFSFHALRPAFSSHAARFPPFLTTYFSFLIPIPSSFFSFSFFSFFSLSFYSFLFLILFSIFSFAFSLSFLFFYLNSLLFYFSFSLLFISFY